VVVAKWYGGYDDGGGDDRPADHVDHDVYMSTVFASVSRRSLLLFSRVTTASGGKADCAIILASGP
jgi:hypothetical protein